ncbi:MAG: NUDIX hydrolase [Acidimicrobiia bacterium]|nr:NUDIX hydrolase [Acidimicrobiia bacterium]
MLAAGGVVIRGSGDAAEVLVVHRPRYDDWSLPKGKVDEGETDMDAAVREVEEETAVTAEPLEELATVRYMDHRGRPKRVRYWRMRVVAEADLVPSDEVDVARWLPLDEAASLLTYEHDRALLTALGRP